MTDDNQDTRKQAAGTPPAPGGVRLTPVASPPNEPVSRLSSLDVATLAPRPTLIINPHAGRKMGISTNDSGPEAVMAALARAGIDADIQPTERPGHATELARQAMQEGRKLIIIGGGDGSVVEAVAGIIGTGASLGIMPLGSVMNTARTLCIPRDLNDAAHVIAQGSVLAMDVGRVNGHNFLEAGGVGLAAGLFGYFDRLDNGASPPGVVRAAWTFMSRLGAPRVTLNVDGRIERVRTPMVTVSNGPFVGAAYAIAPDARVDDGLLDVVVYRNLPVWRILLHLAVVAGGRKLPPPPEAQTFRARRIEIRSGRRPLPVHADGGSVARSPAVFEVLPGALRVLVGVPRGGESCAWQTREP